MMIHDISRYNKIEQDITRYNKQHKVANVADGCCGIQSITVWITRWITRWITMGESCPSLQDEVGQLQSVHLSKLIPV